MADRWGWQSLFAFLAVFSGLVLLLMIFLLPEVSHSRSAEMIRDC